MTSSFLKQATEGNKNAILKQQIICQYILRGFEHYGSEQGRESERADRNQTDRGADRRRFRPQLRRAGDGRRTTAEYLRPESLCRVFRRRRSAQGFGHDGRHQFQGTADR